MTKQANSNGFLGSDERLKKTDDVARSDRGSADAARIQNDGTALTTAERIKMMRNEWKQEVLPNPPPIPGYHLCWLSSTSKGDPIHNRMRLGYEPVKATELFGFEKFSMKGGEWDGFVSCNEMLLFKLPEEIYQAMMVEFHHNMPLEEEQGLRQRIDSENQQRDSNGRQLGSVEGDGFHDLGRARTPIFY